MKNSAKRMVSFLFVTSFALGQNSVKTSNLTAGANAISIDTLSLSPSSEMLDEELYWSIVESSIKETKTQEDQEIYLIAKIEKLTPKEMIGFRLRTDQLLFDTYNENLWCAAYIINGGCSDGGFEYFRCWLISRGKEAYYKVKNNPDALMNLVVKGQENYEFEGFWYVAMNAFKNKTNKELFLYIDYDTFVTNDENYPVLDFTWNVDQPKTMEKICPILYKNLWK